MGWVAIRGCDNKWFNLRTDTIVVVREAGDNERGGEDTHGNPKPYQANTVIVTQFAGIQEIWATPEAVPQVMAKIRDPLGDGSRMKIKENAGPHVYGRGDPNL